MKWDYYDFSTTPYDKINAHAEMMELGKTGWECYAVIYKAPSYCTQYFFKRPIPEPSIPPPNN